MLNVLLTCFFSLFAARQEQPQFKGGQRALDSYLARNLIYPEFSRQNCLQGTVEIGFGLTRAGKIYSSEVTRGFGTDLDKEALRMVRLTSGKWEIPAGYDTTARVVLPVSFSLSEESKCRNVSKENISAAISAYRNYQSLTSVILNFYSRQYAGAGSGDELQHIQELKAQLGYDEKFIDRLLKQAGTKIRQGDEEGACEDLTFVHLLGSDRADKLIAANCGKRNKSYGRSTGTGKY